MPIYSFEDASGNEVEVFFGMDEVPENGATIEHEGQRLTRIVALPRGMVKEYRHVSHSLPRVNPKDPYWPHYNDKNQPVFTSRAQCAKLSDKIRGEYGGGMKYE